MLKEQLRRLEEDVTTLASPSRDLDTKVAESKAEKGMTEDEKIKERTLREELAKTSKELSSLNQDSVARDLRLSGVPPTMEMYETKYKEAKYQMMEAERDKMRALQALQTLVGGESTLKDIVVAAKLENAKRAAMPKRMSIDDYRPEYDGLNVSVARAGPTVLSTSPSRSASRPGSSGSRRGESMVMTPVTHFLNQELPVGTSIVPMDNAVGKGFQVGQKVIIGEGRNQEVRIVTAFGSLILDHPLEYYHPKGEKIVAPDCPAPTAPTASTPLMTPGGPQSTNPWGDKSLVLAGSNFAPPPGKGQPPPPTHNITDEIDDDVPPPPPPEDPFWQKRMDRDRIKQRERMRKWKSIETRPAEHKREWGQPNAVDHKTRRKGYGRRQQYRDDHRRNVRRVRGERGERSRSPRGGNQRDDEGFPLRDGTFVGFDIDDDANDLLASGRVRSELYTDLQESRERHHEGRKKEREIRHWAKQLGALSSSGGDKKELNSILREAQGLNPDDGGSSYYMDEDDSDRSDLDTLMGSEEDSLLGGPAALVLDEEIRERPRRRGTGKSGSRTKTLKSGRVVKDLRSPTQYGNYSRASRYESTGRKYRSRMDSYHRASSYEYQRNAGGSRMDDRIKASLKERRRSKKTQGERREEARLARVRGEKLERRQERQRRKEQRRGGRSRRGGGGGERGGGGRGRDSLTNSEYTESLRSSSPSTRASGGASAGTSIFMKQESGEDVFDALRNIVARRIRDYGHTESDTRAPFAAVDDEDSGLLDMDDIAFALRRIGARLTETQLHEIFELLGEDQDDPDSSDTIVWEDLLTAMHRDDHLVEEENQEENQEKNQEENQKEQKGGSTAGGPAGPPPSMGGSGGSGPAPPPGGPPLSALAKLARAPSTDDRGGGRGGGGGRGPPLSAPRANGAAPHAPPPPPRGGGGGAAHASKGGGRGPPPRGGARPPPPRPPQAKAPGAGNPAVFSLLDENRSVAAAAPPSRRSASSTSSTDPYGMTRTEIGVSIEGLQTRRRMMAVIEVGFPSSSPEPCDNGRMSALQIRQRDRTSSLFTSGHGRRSIQWEDEERQTFTGQALVDWLIDDANVPGVHDAVLEAQSLVEGGWILLDGAPRSGGGRAQDLFQLTSRYRVIEMKWVEIGRTEERRGPSVSFGTTTSLMFALPGSSHGGGADGIVVATTIFGLSDDNDERSGDSGNGSGSGSGTSVLVSGTVALSDLLSSPDPGGMLVGPKSMQYPICVKASSPSSFGCTAPPPDATQRTSMATYVLETSDVAETGGRESVSVTELATEVDGRILSDVAMGLLDLYGGRISQIVQSFDDGTDSVGLVSQRELATNYGAFRSDYESKKLKEERGEEERGEISSSAASSSSSLFKASRLVSDVSRQFDATNAHVHVCHVENSSTGATATYPILTMGMPAAHPLGFSRGGLLRLQDEYLSLRRNVVAGGDGVTMDVVDMERMESLGIEIDKRKDVVLSQCTSGLISSFLATADIYRPGTNPTTNPISMEWWSSTTRAGFLLHFETLLNNSKKDQCLLEDFVVGARALEKMFIQIVQGSGAAPSARIRQVSAARGATTSGHLQIELYLGDDYPFTRLPEAVQRGALIPVRTTVFVHSPTVHPSSNVSV